MVDSHSSVGIVVHHRDLQALVLVRQFRPAVRRWPPLQWKKGVGLLSACRESILLVP